VALFEPPCLFQKGDSVELKETEKTNGDWVVESVECPEMLEEMVVREDRDGEVVAVTEDVE